MSKVTYNQSGYCGASMSERAVQAYDNGEKPKSKWTKAAMLKEISECCEDFDLFFEPEIKKMKKEEIFNTFFYESSRHHTSKYANITYFYALSDDAMYSFFRELTEEEVKQKERERATARALEEKKRAHIQLLQRELKNAWADYVFFNGFEPDSVAALLKEREDLCNIRISKKGNIVVDYKDGKQSRTCLYRDMAEQKCTFWCALPFSASTIRQNDVLLLTYFAEKLKQWKAHE